jgi:integrase
VRAFGLKMSGPPKHLPTEAVQRVLASCERSTVRGKRNYAILLLLARLGLRAGEIVAMQLDDIGWVNGQLAVRPMLGSGRGQQPIQGRRAEQGRVFGVSLPFIL